MPSRQDEVLNKALEIIRSQLNPARIYLFGSRAAGRHQPHSDFDLAVDAPKPPFRRERQLREMVNDSAGLYKVDIVYLPQVEPDLRALILDSGKLIYEKAA